MNTILGAILIAVITKLICNCFYACLPWLSKSIAYIGSFLLPPNESKEDYYQEWISIINQANGNEIRMTSTLLGCIISAIVLQIDYIKINFHFPIKNIIKKITYLSVSKKFIWAVIIILLSINYSSTFVNSYFLIPQDYIPIFLNNSKDKTLQECRYLVKDLEHPCSRFDSLSRDLIDSTDYGLKLQYSHTTASSVLAHPLKSLNGVSDVILDPLSRSRTTATSIQNDLRLGLTTSPSIRSPWLADNDQISSSAIDAVNAMAETVQATNHLDDVTTPWGFEKSYHVSAMAETVQATNHLDDVTTPWGFEKSYHVSAMAETVQATNHLDDVTTPWEFEKSYHVSAMAETVQATNHLDDVTTPWEFEKSYHVSAMAETVQVTNHLDDVTTPWEFEKSYHVSAMAETVQVTNHLDDVTTQELYKIDSWSMGKEIMNPKPIILMFLIVIIFNSSRIKRLVFTF